MIPKKEKTIIHYNVRRFVETVLAQGNIGQAEPFGNSAVLGTIVHQMYQSRGIPGYQAEVELSKSFAGKQIIFELSGKADGIYTNDGSIYIEEIKSTRKDINSIEAPSEVHLAQLKMYGWFYCCLHDIESIILDLIYINRKSKSENLFRAEYRVSELEEYCLSLVQPFIKWKDENEGIRNDIFNELEALEFPFPGFRAGQRKVSVDVYRTIREGKVLFAHAPTGIGKTMAVLFPALKAYSLGLTDKLFFLTAKNSGAEAAEKAMRIIHKSAPQVRWISITAKSKICFQTKDPLERPVCDPELCDYARGYYNKLSNALNCLHSYAAFDRDVIEDLARKYRVCPFEFSLDLSINCDVIIADYNYAFDSASRLKRFFSNGKTDYTFLIDEAHNIIDRARSMYSAALNKSIILDLRRSTTEVLHTGFSRLNTYLLELRKKYNPHSETVECDLPEGLKDECARLLENLDLYLEIHGELPFEVQDFYWELQHINTVLNQYDKGYRTIIRTTRSDITLTFSCIDPSAQLQKVLKQQQSAVFFSATLSPFKYFTSLIAPDLKSYITQVESPFSENNCLRIIDTTISTRYKQRDTSSAAYAKITQDILDTVDGNILVFSPSFSFQNLLLRAMGYFDSDNRLHDKYNVNNLVQSPGMSNEEKDRFIHSFNATPKGLRGFCVTGGTFAESIDLVGDKLVGVVIFGVGLPQLSVYNDTVKDYFEEKYGNGYHYAYIYPGINKILQAAGRVIRSDSDRGFIYLVDDRYRQYIYKTLLPAHWQVQYDGPGKDIISMIKKHFQ